MSIEKIGISSFESGFLVNELVSYRECTSNVILATTLYQIQNVVRIQNKAPQPFSEVQFNIHDDLIATNQQTKCRYSSATIKCKWSVVDILSQVQS